MLERGTKLGPYEVESSIGAGGMGEVYRARDSRLDRLVAVKVLPAEVAANAQLKLRFQREAKTISSLNHPHICHLYDVGEAQVDGNDTAVNYLVMELLEGETLAQRLLRGPLPLEQALRVAIDIAGALDSAHRRGVVHRDLKPGNVMLTKGGAKLLDFGLAKPNVTFGSFSTSTVSPDGATRQKELTEEGTILGTLQYMSPEQLEGTDADARSDIFSFGALLYEIVTGSKAFIGKNRTSLIAAIVDRDPLPISTLQPMTPPALERIIKVCLAKNPDDRWQTAHDLLLQLRWVDEAGSNAGVAAPVSARRRRRERFAWALHLLTAAAAIGITIAALDFTRTPPRVATLSIVPPAKVKFDFQFGAPAISPDGSRLAFVAAPDGGSRSLWVRSMSSGSAQPLAGTEQATHPFWSADSKYIAFFADGKLKKIDANGGPAQILCDAVQGRGGSWSDKDLIIFAPNVYGELSIVSSSGGVPRKITKLRAGDRGHRFPFFLPGGEQFLYLAEVTASGLGQLHNIRLASADGAVDRQLLQSRSGVRYAQGFLFFARDRALLAQRFDPKSGLLQPDVRPIVDGVHTTQRYEGIFTVSSEGTLAYVTGATLEFATLTLFDQGKPGAPLVKPGSYRFPALSHDQTRVAMSAYDSNQRSDVWVADLSRGTQTRLTFDPADEWAPLWSPTDDRIVFSSNAKSGGDIYMKSSSGIGAEELLYANPHYTVATDWSRDGRTIVFQEVDQKTMTDWDIWLFSMDDRKPRVVVKSQFSEQGARISPDGQWLSYTSTESGSGQVYVQGLAGRGGKWQISTDGGSRAHWNPNGKELFYITGENKLMVVDVRTDGDRFVAGIPRELLTAKFHFPPGIPYAVTREGKILAVTLVGETVAEPITVVQNWPRMMEAD